MGRALDTRQLTGLDESHLVTLPCGHRLQSAAANAFADLQAQAREAGFDLVIASSFRSFSRQLAIWNGKASGRRAVYDDRDREVPMASLTPCEQLHAILRYSALPGTSRHHWGTDLDVYDAAVMPPGYELQLSQQEVGPGGLFDSLHSWLDARMATGESHGFYRPYDSDRGGVAPERWHLSYSPVSIDCEQELTADVLSACWNSEERTEHMLLRREIDAGLPQIMARYVSVAKGWCKAR